MFNYQPANQQAAVPYVESSRDRSENQEEEFARWAHKSAASAGVSVENEMGIDERGLPAHGTENLAGRARCASNDNV